MTASLSAQFSDVSAAPFRDRGTPVPPANLAAARPVCQTRVGQTVWCCVDAVSRLGVDSYLVLRPVFRMPWTEFTVGNPLASVVKRLDVIGAPSPFGSSISEMLGEVWRFYMPAGEARACSFFLPSDGMYFFLAAWVTDMAGVLIPGQFHIDGYVWTALGAAHALQTNSAEERPQ